MRVELHEKESSIQAISLDHLDQIIADATQRAKHKDILSIIFLNHENDNSIGLVIGSNKTVLSFTYNHQNPPYYASKGNQDSDEPIMTCFLLFQHHTEFPRKYIVDFNLGLMAVHEFYQMGDLPKCIEWVEV